MSAEKRLIHRLLRSYSGLGRNGRPVKNVNDSVGVEFGLGLIQMELDEKSKVLKMSMWSRYVSTSAHFKQRLINLGSNLVYMLLVPD